jgi:hypothetical protein
MLQASAWSFTSRPRARRRQAISIIRAKAAIRPLGSFFLIGHGNQIADPPQKGPTFARMSRSIGGTIFYRILTGGAMYLFLVIVCGFGAFNSRLSGKNSRLGLLRELAGNNLISLAVFSAGGWRYRENLRNSRFDGNNREFCPLTFSARRRKSPGPAAAPGSAQGASRCAPASPLCPRCIPAAPPLAPRRES